MKRHFLKNSLKHCAFGMALMASMAVNADDFTPKNPMTMWYDVPATATGVKNVWMEYSLPIGNGQLGGSLFGGLNKDEIQFNEKTLWTGKTSDMQGYGGGYGQYKNFGSIYVEDLSGVFLPGKDGEVKDYVRSLDLQEGIGRVVCSSAQYMTSYDRTYFVSNPDKVMVARYTATGKKKLHLLFSFAVLIEEMSITRMLVQVESRDLYSSSDI